MRRCRLVRAALLCGSAANAAVTSTGFTVSLSDVPYFLPPQAVASLSTESVKHLFIESDFVPFTVVKDSGYSAEEIASTTMKYLEVDDVLQEGFFDGT